MKPDSEKAKRVKPYKESVYKVESRKSTLAQTFKPDEIKARMKPRTQFTASELIAYMHVLHTKEALKIGRSL